MRGNNGTRLSAPRWLRSLAAALAITMVAALVPSRVMAESDLTVNDAIPVLQHYGVVKGDQNGDLRLDDNISRAEMATVLVRLMGREEDAQTLMGATTFPDTGNHWASGYIAIASRIGLVKGYDNGNFGPNDPVKYAEMLTMLLRAVGQEPVGGSWPDSILFRAVQLEIQPPNLALGSLAMKPAPRRHVFQSLFLAGTTVETPTGKTLFREHVDSTPPVLTLGTLPEATANDRVTLSGTVTDATSLLVNGKSVVVSANGSFSTELQLAGGKNTFKVQAYDAIRNLTEKTVEVVRASTPSRIEVTGPSRIKFGETGQFDVHIYDASGFDMGAYGLQVETVGNIGTFDVSKQTLKAGSLAAEGKLIFKAGTVTKELNVAVTGPSASVTSMRIRNADGILATGRDTTIEVEMLDASGAVVTADNDRTVTLSLSGLSGAIVRTSSATTDNGVATFTVRSENGGPATARVSSSGIATIERTVQFSTPLRVVLFTDSSRLYPNGVSVAVVHARLENESGATVAYTGSEDLIVNLSVSGPGSIEDGTLTIQRGYANTPFDQATVIAGTYDGTMVVRGTVSGGVPYTVIPLNINVSEPKLSSESKFIVSGPTSVAAGDFAEMTVRIVDKDGETLTDGSYAFQVQVDTSNNDEKTDGIPAGVTVYLGDSVLNPVSDGSNEGSTNDTDDVIARTENGRATIRVRYTRSGQVTITPIPMGGTSKAYNSIGEEGTAVSSAVIPSANVKAGKVSFQNDLGGLKLEADSTLGEQQAGAAVSAGSTTTMKIRVRVVDDGNAWVPGVYNYRVQLSKTGSYTTIVGETSKVVSDGYVEFSVRANGSSVGSDTYTATATRTSGTTPETLTSVNSLRVEVENTAPETPVIASAGGYKSDMPGEPGFIASDDDGMMIVLNPTGEGWASVRVYRDNYSTPIYTSGAIDLSATAVVKVPKSVLPRGTYQYRVSVKNSRGESDKSDLSESVANSGTLTSVSISSAKFTAQYNNTAQTENVLTVYTSGSVACGGLINPDRLKIVNGSNEIPLFGAIAYIGTDPTANCTGSYNREFKLILTSSQAAELASATYAGSATYLVADAGWYESPTREQAGKDTTNNRITPAAYIDRAELDLSNKRLYLFGGGFTTGTFDVTKLSIVDGGNAIPLTLGSGGNAGSPSRNSDSQYTIPLTQNAIDLFVDNNFSGSDVTIEAGLGWFKDGTAFLSATQSKPVRQQIRVTQVQYVDDNGTGKILIKGFGFFDGQANGSGIGVDAAMMEIKDWDASPSVLDLTGATPNVVSDTQIELTLTDAQHTQYKTGGFEGLNIFFQADTGWYLGSRGIPAVELPAKRYGVNAP